MSDGSRLLDLLYETLAATISAIASLEDNSLKCEHLGFLRLAEKFRDFAITEIKHYEAVARRILYLGAKLEYRRHAIPSEHEDLTVMIRENLEHVEAAINRINEGIDIASKIKDAGTRMVLEQILHEEELQYDELAKMLEQISRFGDQYFIERA